MREIKTTIKVSYEFESILDYCKFIKGLADCRTDVSKVIFENEYQFIMDNQNYLNEYNSLSTPTSGDKN